jgi:hypothetical protein
LELLKEQENKVAIEMIFPSNPDVVIYATVNFMQMWGQLLKEADKGKLMKTVQCLEEWINKKQKR